MSYTDKVEFVESFINKSKEFGFNSYIVNDTGPHDLSNLIILGMKLDDKWLTDIFLYDDHICTSNMNIVCTSTYRHYWMFNRIYKYIYRSSNDLINHIIYDILDI